MNKVAPSLFAADYADTAAAIRLFQNTGVDGIHYDIMDNHFVPNISFGPKIIEDVMQKCPLPANVHLMIDLGRENVLKPYLDLPVENITIHIEASASPVHALLDSIRKSGKTAGISIKPNTPVESIVPYLDQIDLILIMSVEPGYSGQSFLPNSLSRITAAKKLIAGRNIDLQVDGGVNRQNAESIIKAGANYLVIGSSFFSDKDPKGWVNLIKGF